MAAPIPVSDPWIVRELASLVSAVGLAAARTIPIAWMVPVFGGRHLPAGLRVALGLGLALLVLPRLAVELPLGASAPLWTLVIVREVAVGLTLGFVTSLFFRAAESAGRLTDVLRGASLADVISPSAPERASPLGDLFLLFATVIFLELGGLGHLAGALARSYDAIPITGTAGMKMQGVADLVIMSSARLLEATIGLAAPAVVALLLADLVLGAIGRAAPQIPLYFAAMPLKALLGVGAVLLGLGALDAALVAGLRGWYLLIEQGIAAWR